MLTAMLWHDGSKETLIQKIAKAAKHYQEKYGRSPEFCLVPPAVIGSDKAPIVIDQFPALAVRPYSYVLPNHYWIGNEETVTKE